MQSKRPDSQQKYPRVPTKYPHRETNDNTLLFIIIIIIEMKIFTLKLFQTFLVRK